MPTLWKKVLDLQPVTNCFLRFITGWINSFFSSKLKKSVYESVINLRNRVRNSRWFRIQTFEAWKKGLSVGKIPYKVTPVYKRENTLQRLSMKETVYQTIACVNQRSVLVPLYCYHRLNLKTKWKKKHVLSATLPIFLFFSLFFLTREDDKHRRAERLEIKKKYKNWNTDAPSWLPWSNVSTNDSQRRGWVSEGKFPTNF